MVVEQVEKDYRDYLENNYIRWGFGNSILYDMCKRKPFHNQTDIIVGKIWIIGRSYAAAIERRRTVGNTNDDFYYNDDKRSAYYVLLDPTMLYGGSLEAFRTAVDEVYTEKAAESIYQAYCFEGYPLFVERDGKTYIAWGDAQRKVFSLVFEENNDYDFTVLERTPDKVTARISTTICLPGGEGYLDSYINCIFLKTTDGWRIDDCAYTEMMTSIGFDDYVPIESPATGDNSFDKISVCLGGMAIVMSVLCLVRKRREE
jgi:hypothetical protein